jgi:type IV pilus assembly protein PilB
MTAEDPVEFNFDGINQVLVRSDIGLTFSAALRSFLRQDPDVIMVGEMRDQETAEIAIRAALTGHLVFSTLHTNDAPSTVNRLVDMGIPAYLVASATKLIMAQRMVRKICSACKVEDPDVSPQALERLGVPPNEIKSFKAYKGKGCNECGGTGYSGRSGLFEVMPVTPALEHLILNNATASDIRKAAVEEGMLTLRMAGIEKLKQGLTSLEEVLVETA